MVCAVLCSCAVLFIHYYYVSFFLGFFLAGTKRGSFLLNTFIPDTSNGTVDAPKARDRMNPVSLKGTKFSQEFERFSKDTKFLCP